MYLYLANLVCFRIKKQIGQIFDEYKILSLLFNESKKNNSKVEED